MMASATWDGHDQHMTSTGDDDFNQFLDMSSMGNMADSMSFEFHSFQPGVSQIGTLNQHHHQLRQRQQADAIMADSDASHIIPPSDSAIQNGSSAMVPSADISAQPLTTAIPSDPITSIDAQIEYLQQQKLHHQQQRRLQEQRSTFFSRHQSVPPTPQSLDMSPGGGQFFLQAEQVAQRPTYDGGYQSHMTEQQELAFTPLVSPAVTPLDRHFNMDNPFANPAAYFSPLTSPALHAQNDSSSVHDYSTQSNNSPIETELDTPIAAHPGNLTNTDLARKARKNNAVKARSKSGVKKSPLTKPQRRKTGPSPALVSQVLSEVDENAQTGDQVLLPLPATPTDVSEENASVSPENLSEMPPPPVPGRRSTSRSPYIAAQNSNSQQPTPRSLTQEQKQQTEPQHQQQQTEEGEQHRPHPATPASLMKLPASKTKRSPANSQEQHVVTDNIESLELPESISKKTIAPAIVPSASPKIASNTAKFDSNQPILSLVVPTPAAAAAAPVSQSPQSKPGSTVSSARKTSQAPNKNSRKRSTSSIHASPALLPKISPKIKPLLPGSAGMSLDDTASRWLMTKSNYQNIVEGNTVPGVTYPSELSTNLTSKRTSHKIAEQGRRNRINLALQNMASLLPDHQKSEEALPASNVPNSKASVVESAINHLKSLQQENVDLKSEIQELKSQLDKLQGSTASDGAGSSSS